MVAVLVLALGATVQGRLAMAAVVAEPLPARGGGRCELHAFTAKQVVEMIYRNVTQTSARSLDEMSKHFSPDVVFTDPVSSTRGWPAYRKAYEQFIGAEKLYYKVMGWACSGRTVYMSWVFGMKNQYTGNQYVEFEGVSRFVLGKNDLIELDADSWNEIPAGYAPFIRKGESGGVKLR
jgi:ketosteroid isomerase-like protein